MFALLKRLIIEHGNRHRGFSTLSFAREGNTKENTKERIPTREEDIEIDIEITRENGYSTCIRLWLVEILYRDQEFQASTTLGFIQLLVIVYEI